MNKQITTKQNSEKSAGLRISLRTLLGVIAFCAMACALFLQRVDLLKTRASLARYEASRIPTALASKQFRVITDTVLQTDHAAVIRYRIESATDHFATISSEGGSNGARSSFDPQTGLYVTEAVLLIDHVSSQNVVKVVPKVAGAQGYSVASVSDDYSLDDTLTIHNLDMVYSRSDPVELFEIDGNVYSLELKP